MGVDVGENVAAPECRVGDEGREFGRVLVWFVWFDHVVDAQPVDVDPRPRLERSRSARSPGEVMRSLVSVLPHALSSPTCESARLARAFDVWTGVHPHYSPGTLSVEALLSGVLT
jgi:hypothetical protein